MRFTDIVAGLASVFTRGRTQTSSATSAVPGRYLDRAGRPLPTAAGAWRRVEEEVVAPGLTETRYYRQGVEWLQRRVRQGLDADGQPYLLRVTYWPWGQELVRLEKCVRDGRSCVEYQRFFGTGDLLAHKLLVGRQLRTNYTFQLTKGEAYTYEEMMPVYPGGSQQLLDDIGRLVKYPVVALRNREAGKVFLHFIVRPDGLLGDIRVKQGVTPALDAAAVQAIRDLRSKRWRPGFQNRRAVAVFYTVPITFALK